MRALCGAVAAGLLLALGGCNEASIGVRTGQQAPDFQGEDASGVPIKLSSYRGKVVLLDFWATWCGPCRKMIPHELELAKRYAGRPFAIVGVSADSSREALREFLAEQKLPWPNVFDGSSGPIARAWRVEAFPTFVLIDQDGIVRKAFVGAGSPETMDAAIEEWVQRAEQAGK